MFDIRLATETPDEVEIGAAVYGQIQIGSFKEAMERDLRKVRAVLSRVKTRLMSLPFALPSFDIAAHRLYQVLPALATTETV